MTRVAATLGTTPSKVVLLGRNADLGRPIWSNVFRNKMFSELPPGVSRWSTHNDDSDDDAAGEFSGEGDW
jgi:hypothetical protein